jgi:hypothetical protein
MSSPSWTVNDLMVWLKRKLGLHLPLLPLKGFPASIKAFWHKFLERPPPPSGSPPWVFPVEGTWPELLPEGSRVVVADLRIIVGRTPAESP